MAPRPRFSGSSKDLSLVLAPFVKTAGWLSYGEKTSSPLQVPTLIAHKALILALSSICHNLAFTKETVTDAFVDIASEKKFSVLSTDALKTEWCESMSAQLRTVCRHVAHARVQKKHPSGLNTWMGFEILAALGQSLRLMTLLPKGLPRHKEKVLLLRMARRFHIQI